MSWEARAALQEDISEMTQDQNGAIMSYGIAVQQEMRGLTRDLRHAIPEVYEGYRQLHRAAVAAGALDSKTKELIALAIAASKQCDGCIAAHAHGAAQQGASEQEVAEALGVAVMLNGGPATVYGARAFAAFREFHTNKTGSNTAPPQ
jgi:AhpD family alkylhydroperoxidase